MTDRGLRIDEVWIAADCGTVFDPVNAEAQLTGAAIFGLGHAMNCELTYENHAVQQTNFHDFEGMRLHQTPASTRGCWGLPNGCAGWASPQQHRRPRLWPMPFLLRRASVCVRCRSANSWSLHEESLVPIPDLRRHSLARNIRAWARLHCGTAPRLTPGTPTFRTSLKGTTHGTQRLSRHQDGASLRRPV
ncbi:MAG: molybdopterin cofactor-binding domain-containing protein [Nitratireductor sp.]